MCGDCLVVARVRPWVRVLMRWVVYYAPFHYALLGAGCWLIMEVAKLR